ncbi:MAG TPA: universal stress protein [Candidatus Nitrosotalea sp.]|nr:universal stress protein [Candidatus Nitrosotalea sp.]
MPSKSIRKILVPLDGSKYSMDGLHEAILLAKQFGAKITGLCVIPLTPPVAMLGLQTSFKSYMTDGAAKFMAEATKIASHNGVNFQGKLIYGEVSTEIAKFANDKKFDLVVIGSSGRSELRDLFLGSVSNTIIHRSQVPVLVIK